MSLDDWLALLEESRRERRKHWKNIVPVGQTQAPEETEWSALIQEAAEQFRRQYGEMQDILYIAGSCSFDADLSISIEVGTRLMRGQTLAGLPSEYATFRVKQQPLGEEIQSFKDTWAAVLSRLFDWDPISIAEFIADQEGIYRSVWFLHDPPCQTIPRDVLARSVLHSPHGYRPMSLTEAQSTSIADQYEMLQIGGELVKAIGGEWYLHQEPDYDWEAAEQRIARIVEKYDRP
jgi:hypothetical protein